VHNVGESFQFEITVVLCLSDILSYRDQFSWDTAPVFVHGTDVPTKFDNPKTPFLNHAPLVSPHCWDIGNICVGHLSSFHQGKTNGDGVVNGVYSVQFRGTVMSNGSVFQEINKTEAPLILSISYQQSTVGQQVSFSELALRQDLLRETLWDV
jgi:hypothetical protein